MARKFKLTYESRSASAVNNKKYESVASSTDANSAKAMLNPLVCFNIECEEVDSSTPHSLEMWVMAAPKPVPRIEERYALIGDKYFSIEKLLSE